jgi:hypothetical protein
LFIIYEFFYLKSKDKKDDKTTQDIDNLSDEEKYAKWVK